jgi:hypothetical protein
MTTHSIRRVHTRWLSATGVLLTVAGLAMWVLPGPGLPVLAVGVVCSAVAGVLRLCGRSR